MSDPYLRSIAPVAPGGRPTSAANRAVGKRIVQRPSSAQTYSDMYAAQAAGLLLGAGYAGRDHAEKRHAVRSASGAACRVTARVGKGALAARPGGPRAEDRLPLSLDERETCAFASEWQSGASNRPVKGLSRAFCGRVARHVFFCANPGA